MKDTTTTNTKPTETSAVVPDYTYTGGKKIRKPKVIQVVTPTTTTIDRGLRDILVEHADLGGDIYCADKDLINDILNWHKQQTRSYVLEVIGEEDNKHWNSARANLRAEQRAKLDQTLKAIEALGLTSKETEE